MKFKCFFLAVILLTAVISCKQSEPGAGTGVTPAIGERMHMVSFEMPSLTHKEIIDSRQFEGQVLLVAFFASWCPPCVQEIPSLIALQDSYKTKGFSVVAFSVDEGDLAPLEKLIVKNGINYPVFVATPDIKRNFGGITGIPVIFLVNRKGEIVNKYLGYTRHNILEAEIKTMLTTG